ncbi:ABC transporter ATP-binding protein [Nocardioides sp. GY 10127]|uniref:ABC transporter ATP-binding protein n=1 Tax=Nocardioides sp. GY 10127 TaxID=2569762 RepID=UPI0010A7F9DF|nr:ABC transporter ATP-binding protein [Nocardioides sp. GY 10127]TIC80129.1 ABC transporter ATP-binding protein [Nocardioides sp. GY 10127]
MTSEQQPGSPPPRHAAARGVVEVRGLVVRRGGRAVLDGLDLEVGAGVTGLLGPSGCGKSTLMRALVGVQRTHGGDVTVLGEPAGSAGLRERVGYVTQAAAVYDDLTVAENLRFFARVLGLRRGEGTSAVDRVLGEVDLAGHRDDVVGRLSGGQRSRVSLAVALLRRPDLLVLDEPTVGLDPVLRQDLWALFHRLAAGADGEPGTAVLVSSHVMDEAERCDRLLLMREGRVIADDTPAAVKAAAGVASVEEAFLALVHDAPTEGGAA